MRHESGADKWKRYDGASGRAQERHIEHSELGMKISLSAILALREVGT